MRTSGARPGIAFWTGLTLVGSALPVRLPRGTVVSVSAAPVIATIALGGPLAAAIVAAIGTTDSREIRGQVPWYGTLFNHSAVVLVRGDWRQPRSRFVRHGEPRHRFLPIAAFLGLLIGFRRLLCPERRAGSLRCQPAHRSRRFARFGRRISAGSRQISSDWRRSSWLMAQIFTLPNGVGWWATPLFVVPLFTTRLAYHRYVETRELFEQTIGALANAVDARDRYTRGHSNRVSHISEAMCRVMRLPEPEIEKIKWAGLLHDVGKIGIRDNILLKEGPLDRDERVLMNQHPSIGAEIVAPATPAAGRGALDPRPP